MCHKNLTIILNAHIFSEKVKWTLFSFELHFHDNNVVSIEKTVLLSQAEVFMLALKILFSSCDVNNYFIYAV